MADPYKYDGGYSYKGGGLLDNSRNYYEDLGFSATEEEYGEISNSLSTYQDQINTAQAEIDSFDYDTGFDEYATKNVWMREGDGSLTEYSFTDEQLESLTGTMSEISELTNGAIGYNTVDEETLQGYIDYWSSLGDINDSTQGLIEEYQSQLDAGGGMQIYLTPGDADWDTYSVSMNRIQSSLDEATTNTRASYDDEVSLQLLEQQGILDTATASMESYLQEQSQYQSERQEAMESTYNSLFNTSTTSRYL